MTPKCPVCRKSTWLDIASFRIPQKCTKSYNQKVTSCIYSIPLRIWLHWTHLAKVGMMDQATCPTVDQKWTLIYNFDTSEEYFGLSD